MANINFRTDDKVKSGFESLCNELGLPVSTALNIFMKQSLREGGIPFELTTDPFYSETNMAHLRRGIAALDAGKGVAHELIEVDGE